MVKCHEVTYLDYQLSHVFKIFLCTCSSWDEHRFNSRISFYSMLFLSYYDKACSNIVYKGSCTVYLSAVSTKSYAVNIPSKASAFLQSVSNLKRGCKWVTRSWWVLSGKAHETFMWNYLNPLRQRGHDLRKVGICLLRTPVEAVSPLWFYLWPFWKQSLHTLKNSWLRPGPPLHRLLSSHRSQVLSYSAPQRVTAGFYFSLESWSCLCVGCCLKQDRITFFHPIERWGLVPPQKLLWHGWCAACSWHHQGGNREVCPVLWDQTGNVAQDRWGLGRAPAGLLTLSRVKSRGVSWPPRRHSTLTRCAWFWQKEVAHSCISTWMDLPSDCFIFPWLRLECFLPALWVWVSNF